MDVKSKKRETQNSVSLEPQTDDSDELVELALLLSKPLNEINFKKDKRSNYQSLNTTKKLSFSQTNTNVPRVTRTGDISTVADDHTNNVTNSALITTIREDNKNEKSNQNENENVQTSKVNTGTDKKAGTQQTKVQIENKLKSNRSVEKVQLDVDAAHTTMAVEKSTTQLQDKTQIEKSTENMDRSIVNVEDFDDDLTQYFPDDLPDCSTKRNEQNIENQKTSNHHDTKICKKANCKQNMVNCSIQVTNPSPTPSQKILKNVSTQVDSNTNSYDKKVLYDQFVQFPSQTSTSMDKIKEKTIGIHVKLSGEFGIYNLDFCVGTENLNTCPKNIMEKSDNVENSTNMASDCHASIIKPNENPLNTIDIDTDRIIESNTENQCNSSNRTRNTPDVIKSHPTLLDKNKSVSVATNLDLFKGVGATVQSTKSSQSSMLRKVININTSNSSNNTNSSNSMSPNCELTQKLDLNKKSVGTVAQKNANCDQIISNEHCKKYKLSSTRSATPPQVQVEAEEIIELSDDSDATDLTSPEKCTDKARRNRTHTQTTTQRAKSIKNSLDSDQLAIPSTSRDTNNIENNSNLDNFAIPGPSTTSKNLCQKRKLCIDELITKMQTKEKKSRTDIDRLQRKYHLIPDRVKQLATIKSKSNSNLNSNNRGNIQNNSNLDNLAIPGPSTSTSCGNKRNYCNSGELAIASPSTCKKFCQKRVELSSDTNNNLTRDRDKQLATIKSNSNSNLDNLAIPGPSSASCPPSTNKNLCQSTDTNNNLTRDRDKQLGTVKSNSTVKSNLNSTNKSKRKVNVINLDTNTKMSKCSFQIKCCYCHKFMDYVFLKIIGKTKHVIICEYCDRQHLVGYNEQNCLYDVRRIHNVKTDY